MKADRDDAPEWLTSRTRKRGNPGMILAGVLGTLVTLGALNLAGQAFLQTTVKNLAENRQQPKPTPVAEIIRSAPTPSKDWDRVVEQQPMPDAVPQQQPEQHTGSDNHAVKQTVFNDQNYTPRGADNVLSLRGSYQPVEPEKSAGKMRVTVIKETKDQTCWPLKEGSIERRNCKQYVGLERRINH